jgi:heat shock protein HtpX
MRQASAAHRLVNLVQSTLLLGVMAAIAWAALTTVVTADLALLLALGMIAGLAFSTGAPKRFLLSAYQARRITGAMRPA